MSSAVVAGMPYYPEGNKKDFEHISRGRTAKGLGIMWKVSPHTKLFHNLKTRPLSYVSHAENYNSMVMSL